MKGTDDRPAGVVLETHLPNLPRRQGKVRDIYDLGERLLIVATDGSVPSTSCCPRRFPARARC